ncbi:MAG: hypothetical protein Kow0047_32150 [Anaerolineae bacterium]
MLAFVHAGEYQRTLHMMTTPRRIPSDRFYDMPTIRLEDRQPGEIHIKVD